MQDDTDPTKLPIQKRKLWLILGPIVFIAAAGVALWLLKPRYPLPTTVVKGANFTLYYPSSLPADYRYVKNSAKLQAGIVFYTLQGQSGTIQVSEQAAPPNPPNLKSVPGFNAITTAAGNGIIGLNKGRVTVVLINNTSLITISGTQKVANDTVTAVAQNLHSL